MVLGTPTLGRVRSERRSSPPAPRLYVASQADVFHSRVVGDPETPGEPIPQNRLAVVPAPLSGNTGLGDSEFPLVGCVVILRFMLSPHSCIRLPDQSIATGVPLLL